MLPEDGDVSGLRSVTTDSKTQKEDEDSYSTHLPSSFVPSTAQQMTEQETIRQSGSPATGGSTYSLMASQQFNTDQ